MPKRFLIAAAPAILALTAPPLIAQGGEQHGGGQGHGAERGGGQGGAQGGGRGGGGEHAQAPARAEQRSAPEQARPQHQSAPRMAAPARAEHRAAPEQAGSQHASVQHASVQHRAEPTQTTGHPGANHSAQGRGEAAAMRPGHAASHQNLRQNIQAPRQFSAGAFQAPRGFSQRRWRYGQRLPHAYFGRRYWISNYAAYWLFAPPYGLVWVRLGPDALLIDEVTGEIIQVRYGLFI